MRKLLIYSTPSGTPLYDFLSGLERKLRVKLLLQLSRLRTLSIAQLREPHFKHFVIEKYRDLFELREKNRILVRIIFTIRPDGDIILLAPFVKKQKRDTMQALDLSLKMLAEIRADPSLAAEFVLPKEEVV